MWFELATLVLFALLAWWTATPSASRLRQQGDAFARRNRAFVDSEFVAPFDRRTRWAFRVQAAFLLAYGLTTIVLDEDNIHPGTSMIYVSLVAWSPVTWGFVRVLMVGREFPVPVGRVLIARPRRVVLSDYVSPRLQVLVWLDLALAAGALLVLLLADPGQIGTTVFLALLVLGVVVAGAAAFAYAAVRTTSKRPQSAVDACHLYLQDAWRAESLYGAFAFVVAVALAFVTCVVAVLEPASPFIGIGLAVGGVLVAVHILVLFRERLRFRSILWPMLAPHEVLLPGQPVPLSQGAVG